MFVEKRSLVKIVIVSILWLLMSYWSGRKDLNPRPPRPEHGALTKSYSPIKVLSERGISGGIL